jgi:alpha-beta hydrolase superfamily lysophospholipase
MNRLIVALGAASLGAAAAATHAASPPSETVVEAPGPLGPLKAVLAMPAGKPSAAVVIVPGSGPTDWDGNSPLGVRAQPYKLLAQDLGARGIASLRIDKRGMFASAGAVADANRVTIADYATDVRQWVKTAKARTGLPCIWILGHSEGGLVALAAAQAAPDVCGLILVASPGRPVGEVLRGQLKANPANSPLMDQANRAIDQLEAGRKIDTSGMDPALLPLFAPQVQDYLLSLFSYDPARLAASVSKPMLIIRGTSDLQTQEEDSARLAASARHGRLIVLPGVNHVLKAVPVADRQANIASYADPSLPLAPGVVEAIAAFLAAPPR